MGETCRKLPIKAIGERFELAGLIYEVQESEAGCGGCGFFYEEECECTLTPGEYDLVGYCGSVLRRDDKNVIFKYIGEVP
ncbi:MAG: hypothetical protein IKI44_06335 [Bacteroidaceae bacterium]|nr:hypothetical protein [Bacteroidaceae bacterium]